MVRSFRSTSGAFAVVVSLLLVPVGARAASTPEQSCRAAVGKGGVKLLDATLKATTKCLKTRIKTPGSSTNCLDAAGYDVSGAVARQRVKFLTTIAPGFATQCPGAVLGGLSGVCVTPPAACAATCTGCGDSNTIAACIACRIIQAGVDVTADLYGTPPDLSAAKAAQKCQNAIGKDAEKYTKTRMGEQDKCRKAVDAGTLRVPCTIVDLAGKIAKIRTKGVADIVGKCLTKPGADQIPSLDTAAQCLSSDASGAAACAIASVDEQVDGLFALLSAPAELRGIVMTTATGAMLPLPGVRVEIPDARVGVRTDANGVFRLSPVPPGANEVYFDGQAVGNYPRVGMTYAAPLVGARSIGIVPLPEIDVAHAVLLPVSGGVVTSTTTVTNSAIPNASLVIPAGTAITMTPPNRAPKVSISTVPFTPMGFPQGVFSPLVLTLQPEGMIIDPPAAMTFPNAAALAPLSGVDIYAPDFENNAFITTGTGTVSGDGVTIATNGGVIGGFDWYFPAPPPAGCMTTVQGRVVQSGSLAPLGGADVCVSSACVTTPSNGTFSIALLFCPQPSSIATAAWLDTATGTIWGGANAQATVFNSVTNVGDVVVKIPDCGNDAVEFPEECDIGDRIAGDGCSPVCRIEQCGNNVVDPGEECDGGPGCGRFCTLCGDGIVAAGGEECDAGAANGTQGSGCSANCLVSVCGNGIVEDGEACDTGPANGGANNPCNAQCQFVAGNGITFTAVRSRFGCGEPGESNPNTTTSGNIVACSPVVLFSTDFHFGPAGKGLLSAGPVGGGADVVVTANLTDVRDAGDALLTTAAGWMLKATVRVTLLGSGPGLSDVTVMDRAVTAPLALAAPGALSGSASIVAAFPATFWTGFTTHNIEVVDIIVLDPNDDEFAVPGVLADSPPQLAVDAPTAALGGKVPLVSAYVSCKVPTLTQSGIPGCGSPTTFSSWQFAVDGAAAVTAQAAGNDVKFNVTASGLRVNGSPVSATGKLEAMLKCTEIDSSAGEVTVITFPFPITLPVSGGAASAQYSINTYLSQPGFNTSFSHQQVSFGRTGSHFMTLRDNQNRAVAVPGVRQ